MPKTTAVSWQKKSLAFGLAAAVYGVLWLIRFPCLFFTATGVPCPGCGMSRALWALLQGHIGEAVRWHPMVFSLPVIGLLIWTDGVLFRRPWADRLLLIGIGVGFLACYVMRLSGVWLTRII